MTSKESKDNLKKALVEAEKAYKLHQQIVKLRRIILPLVRKTIKANIDKLQKIRYNNSEIDWMVDKVKRGYFGTDVRTEELPHMISTLQKYLK